MAATFDSEDEWTEYYSRHKSVDNCYQCHGKRNCIVTEATFGDRPTVVRTENKKKKEITGDKKEKMLTELLATTEELKLLSKEFQ